MLESLLRYIPKIKPLVMVLALSGGAHAQADSIQRIDPSLISKPIKTAVKSTTGFIVETRVIKEDLSKKEKAAKKSQKISLQFKPDYDSLIGKEEKSKYFNGDSSFRQKNEKSVNSLDYLLLDSSTNDFYRHIFKNYLTLHLDNSEYSEDLTGFDCSVGLDSLVSLVNSENRIKDELEFKFYFQRFVSDDEIEKINSSHHPSTRQLRSFSESVVEYLCLNSETRQYGEILKNLFFFYKRAKDVVHTEIPLNFSDSARSLVKLVNVASDKKDSLHPIFYAGNLLRRKKTDSNHVDLSRFKFYGAKLKLKGNLDISRLGNSDLTLDLTVRSDWGNLFEMELNAVYAVGCANDIFESNLRSLKHPFSAESDFKVSLMINVAYF